MFELPDPSRALVDKDLETCLECQDLLAVLQEDQDTTLADRVVYDSGIERFSKTVKRYRRWLKALVGLTLVIDVVRSTEFNSSFFNQYPVDDGLCSAPTCPV